MKGFSQYCIGCLVMTVGLLWPFDSRALETWQTPFDSGSPADPSTDSILSLNDVLGLVAAQNPTLKSLDFDREAARSRLVQAGLWSNPELGAEIEEVGWDAPGLKESEITVSLAQEFELFGQRGARRQLARAEIDAVELETRLAAYELYLQTKQRYYTLAHAQEHLALSRTSAELAGDVVENIKFRIEKGAALQSEMLLAQLEQQRGELRLQEARQKKTVAGLALQALWNDATSDLTVLTGPEPESTDILEQVAMLEDRLDSTGAILSLHRQAAILRAEQSLTAAEARPTVTLSGGYKHNRADKSNSLLFGVSLPLPFFNRNQGDRGALEARVHSLAYRIDRERLNAAAEINGKCVRLRHLVQKHDVLDSLLRPTAQEAYDTLERAYRAGRVPYTQLLEAERSLNEVRFEHNDILLAIYEQLIALESLTGATLRTNKEN